MPIPLLHTAWNSAEDQGKYILWAGSFSFLMTVTNKSCTVAIIRMKLIKDATWIYGGAGMTRLSKAMFRIGTTAFWFGHCTGERPRACAHLYGTITGGPHVCVHTNSAIDINGQAWWTLTPKGAFRVDAASIHTNARCLTFINVCCREGRSFKGQYQLIW